MNFRTDHWAMRFDDATQWKIYYKIRRMRWTDALDWLAKEYDVHIKDSAFYEWRKAMDAAEHKHHKAEMELAELRAKDIAKSRDITDEETAAAFMQFAVEAVDKTHDADDAKYFVNMATAIMDRRLKEQELELKKQAQATKDETLRLAREKFEAAEKRLAAVQGVAEDKLLTTEDKLAKIKEIFG